MTKSRLTKKQQQKIFYKVLCTTTGQLASAIYDGDLDLCTIYKENEWVESPLKGSYLFVFDSYEHANNFRHKFCSGSSEYFYPIYTVAVQGIHKATLVTSESVYKFWKLKKQHKKTSHIPTIYWEGTIGVEKVMLLEKVG